MAAFQKGSSNPKEVEALINSSSGLRSDDPQAYDRAQDALVAMGPRAVPGLIESLSDSH